MISIAILWKHSPQGGHLGRHLELRNMAAMLDATLKYTYPKMSKQLQEI